MSHAIPRVSQRFCAADSDLKIRSCDDVSFLLHRENLTICLGSWECGLRGDDDVVMLPESAATLDLLFRFCYPERHPDLEKLEFHILSSLAEAAEKYKLYAAINVCKIRMRDTLPQQALEVLIYAAEHAYDDIIDMAAPLVVLETPLSELILRLPPDYRVRWVLYHEVWQNVVREAISYYNTWASSYYTTSISSIAQMTCSLCGRGGNVEADVNRLLHRLGAGLGALADLDATFTFCRHVPPGTFSSWRTRVVEHIKRVPVVSSLSKDTMDITHMTPPSFTATHESNHRVSQHSCGTDSDVIFQSSDGVLFHMHKVNLEVCAAGFAPPGTDARGEIVPLTETAVTLKFLFRFCYPERHPDVETMKFDVLALLAEAAEKYQVFAAMNICKIYMKKLVPKLAPHILGYAARHDYHDILDIAAPLVVVQENLSETLPKLPADMMMRWIKYFEVVRPSPPRSRNGKKQKVPIRDIPTFSTFR